MACVTKLPDPEKSISEASALQRAAALEEYGEDVASYSKRLDEKPADCATLCNRAFCYVKLGKFEEARKDAEAASLLMKRSRAGTPSPRKRWSGATGRRRCEPAAGLWPWTATTPWR